MSDSIKVHICLSVPRDMYAELFLKSEEVGVNFDVYVQLLFSIRALGLFK